MGVGAFHLWGDPPKDRVGASKFAWSVQKLFFSGSNVNRKPNSSKAIAGTLRRDRLKGVAAATQLEQAPQAPAHLSARAQAEWERVAPEVAALGILARSDLRALELLAETLATEAHLREVLDGEGLTTPTAAGGSKAHPALRALDAARTQSQRMLNAFGLTPIGRQSIDAPPPKPEANNPFSQFANGKRKPIRGKA